MEINYKPQIPETPRPIVIFGAGGIVRDAHLPAYSKAGFTVASIYNRSRPRAEALAEQYNIPHVYETVEEAIEKAPEGAIFDLALMPAQFIDVLEKLPEGSSVLIQKPMGDSLEQALAIREVCSRRKLIAAINCQLRYAPFVSAARDIIDRGLIGELYDVEVRLTTHTPWEIFPNVVNHPRLEIQQHSIHHIDLLMSFVGQPNSVMAKTLRNPAKPMSSTRSTILLDYGDMMHAAVTANHDHEFGGHQQESFIKWEGTKGAIKAKMGLLLNYPEGVPDEFEYCIVEEGKDSEWVSVDLEGTWFPDAFIGTMAALQRYTVGMSDSLDISVENICKTMAVVEAAYTSSEQGGVAPAAI